MKQVSTLSSSVDTEIKKLHDDVVPFLEWVQLTLLDAVSASDMKEERRRLNSLIIALMAELDQFKPDTA
jgi:hypothetical protein